MSVTGTRTPFPASPKLSHPSEGGVGSAVVAADDIVANFPGPAVLCDDGCSLLAANAAAAALAQALAARDADLLAVLSGVLRSGQPATHRHRLAAPEGALVFDLSLLPLETGAGNCVLVLGKDSTFEMNLASALIASRTLFQDLVTCSVDFAWETKPDGRFSFVSPKGALGFTARELDSTLASDLLVDADPQRASPFETCETVEDAELWLRCADGGRACVRISTKPVIDNEGRWLATRGVCRDITAAREREEALAQAREREALVQSVVDAMRNVISPDEILQVAVASIVETVAPDHLTIMRPGGANGWAVAVEQGRPGAALLSDAFMALGDNPPAVVEHERDDAQQLALPCRYRHEVKGWLCAWWQGGNGASERASHLLRSVADHIGIALAQIEVQEKLERLSRVDELTGLLNRRAFREIAVQRISHHRRTGRPATLLFVDMDNFKAVNDINGHQAGDEALKALAGLLRDAESRRSDVAARLGGDEFALWLEETDLEGGLNRANRLLQASETLRRFSGSPDRPLGISVGLVVVRPDDTSELEALIEQADEAMYHAKRRGKGQIAVAGATQGS